MVYSFLCLTVMNCSSAHMVFLAMIRYLLTVHPLESKIRLTVPIVIALCLMIWVYSFLFSAFIFKIISTSIKDFYDTYSLTGLTGMIIRLLWGSISICGIIIIHIKKMKALKNASVTNIIHKRMNVVISIILLIFVSYQISLMLRYIADIAFKYFIVLGIPICSIIRQYLFSITTLFGLINYSCNSYILFFASQMCFLNKHQKPKRSTQLNQSL